MVGERQSNVLYVHNLIAVTRRRLVMVSNYCLELCLDLSGHNDYSLYQLLYQLKTAFSHTIYICISYHSYGRHQHIPKENLPSKRHWLQLLCYLRGSITQCCKAVLGYHRHNCLLVFLTECTSKYQ